MICWKASISARGLRLVPVPVQNSLLLLAGNIVNGQKNLTRLTVLETVPQRSFVWSNLLPLLDNYSVSPFICWHKLFLVIHFPSQNRNVPHQCPFSLWNKQKTPLVDRYFTTPETKNGLWFFNFFTSAAGISMVSDDPGLTTTSETASFENSVSSSLLKPPYWTGISSAGMYLHQATMHKCYDKD